MNICFFYRPTWQVGSNAAVDGGSSRGCTEILSFYQKKIGVKFSAPKIDFGDVMNFESAMIVAW